MGRTTAVFEGGTGVWASRTDATGNVRIDVQPTAVQWSASTWPSLGCASTVFLIGAPAEDIEIGRFNVLTLEQEKLHLARLFIDRDIL
jgi:hypothetical protein